MANAQHHRVKMSFLPRAYEKLTGRAALVQLQSGSAGSFWHSVYSPAFSSYNITMIWKPWILLTVAVAGWMSRQQQEVIAYLREENKILREKFGRKRILLSIEQKRRPASNYKVIEIDDTERT